MSNEIIVQDLELQSLIGFDGNPSNGLILHPDGVHLVYPLGTNVTAYNWTTKKQRFFDGLSNVISAVAVSKSGKYVGAGQVNYMGFRTPVAVWKFETGQMITKYEPHTVRVESIAFSCCETYLITLGGLDDGSIMVYDVERKEMLCRTSAAKSTAGVSTVLRPVHLRRECFVVAGDNTLTVWTCNKEQRNMHGLEASFAKVKRKILCAVIDDTDEYAYCGTSTGDVVKMKLNFSSNVGVTEPLNAPKLIGCFAKHPKAKRRGFPTIELYSKGITSLYLLKADGSMIVGSGDGVVELVKQKPARPKDSSGCTSENRLVNPTQPLFVALKSANVQSLVTSIQLMKETVLVGTADCEIFAVDAKDFGVVRMFTCHTSAVYGLAFPRGYSNVFATSSKHDVRLWSADTLRELLRMTVKSCVSSGVLFSHDGTQIVTSWNDGKIRIFTPETGRLLYTINNCHHKGVTAIAMTTDDRRLLSGGGDGQVRIWNVENSTGALVVVLKEHKGPVKSIDVHPSNNEAITASTDGTCIVWDIVRHTRLAIMFSKTVFTSAVYHPNGVQLLTCGTNRYIGFWESVNGTLIREVEGSLSSALNTLDITSTGKYFVSGSSDQMVKIWLFEEGITTHVGVGHAGTVTNVKVSPDGRFVVSTSADGGVFLWRFPYDPDIVKPESRDGAASVASERRAYGSREQQEDRSRRLSSKTKAPAPKENISVLSKTHSRSRVAVSRGGKKTSATCDGTATTKDGNIGAAGDGKAREKSVNGSVKCVCRTTTCVCGNDRDGNSRKHNSSAVK